MSSAYRYLPHYTVDDYRQWEGDWELWQGIPVSMSPSPFGRHQECCFNLAFALRSSVKSTLCQATVLYEIDWVVSNDTVVRPDVLVLCGDAPTRHVEHPPELVAEVLSSSTEQRDRTEKFKLYQDKGVKYYLVLDPIKNTLDPFKLDDTGAYQRQAFDGEIVLDVCDDCHLRFPANDLFASTPSA